MIGASLLNCTCNSFCPLHGAPGARRPDLDPLLDLLMSSAMGAGPGGDLPAWAKATATVLDDTRCECCGERYAWPGKPEPFPSTRHGCPRCGADSWLFGEREGA